MKTGSKPFSGSASYLALVLAPLLILLFGGVPSGSWFWWDFSMALGFSAMANRFWRVSAP